MGGHVADPRGLHSADEHREGSEGNDVRGTRTDAQVANSRGRQAGNDDRWTAWRYDRASDMGDQDGDHRAGVHVGDASCWRHDGPP
jgi:hypothetical protein